jgi:Zn-dependent protease
VAIGVALIRKGTITESTIIYFIVLVPSVILHELSHGVVANWLGDDTAKRAGRLTLNPLRHIDPFGTIILPILLLLSAGTAFGYAKPVPVNIGRLRNPRNGSVAVALAGPGTNFLLFLICALVWRTAVHQSGPLFLGTSQAPLGYNILFEAGEVNILLMLFNLIPLPPLDGSAVIERLLPASSLQGYLRIRPYGMVIVMLFSLFVWRTQAVQLHIFQIIASLWNTFGGTHLVV